MVDKDNIKLEQAEAIMDLEKIIGKSIPYLEEIKYESFGIQIEGNNIIGLGLAKCGLTNFPEPIIKLSFLKVLTLEKNKIKRIPESIGNLIELRKLWLSQNLLIKIPPSIGNLTKLEELYMGWNSELSFFPDSIVNLKSLRIIELQNCKFASIPELIGKLTSLEELELSNNKLKLLPESIGDLTSLHVLHLLGNLLSELPESIGNLKSLNELWLGSNQLSTLPESIGNLQSLEDLDLGSNKIKTLPESFGNLTSVKKIDLESNNLKVLPESLGSLTSLDKFNLVGNKLKFLPESIGDLSSLRVLFIDKNKLENLPSSFWKLKNLRRVQLYDNNWKDEWKVIDDYNTSAILDFCRGKTPITIYISYLKEDEKKHRITEVIEILKNYEEILEVYNNEIEKIPKSHTLIPICTQDFMATETFRQELSLALKHDIEIIPIKDKSIEWSDLNQIDLRGEDIGYFDLGNKKGFEYDSNNIKPFCIELYEYIRQYKRDVNLFEPEERKINKQIQNVKNIIEKFIGSEDFEIAVKANLPQLKKIYIELKNE